MADKSIVASPSLDSGGAPSAPARRSEWRRFSRIFFGRKLYLIGFIVVVIIILVAIFAPLLSQYEPTKNSLRDKLEGPSWNHLLGTDQLGRDILCRIMYGARVSLIIGFTAVFGSAIIGALMGLTAAHFGGLTFAIIMRITDVLMSLPSIILMMLIAGLASARSMWVVVFALGFGFIPGMCRMMCGQALSVKQNDYVLAGRGVRTGTWACIL